MHLFDGVLNHGAASGLAGAAATAVSYAVVKVRMAFLEKIPLLKRRFASFPDAGGEEVGWQSRISDRGREKIQSMATVGAFIFAIQMVNFPIAGGTSGHLLGGVFAALVLGPFEAFIVMALVLVVQAFAFGDGGILALGANIMNMGLVGTMGGYGVFVLMRKQKILTLQKFLARAGIAAWISVTAGAFVIAVELAISGTVLFAPVFFAMMKYHALIGLGEALITIGILLALKKGDYTITAWEESKENNVP